MAESKSELEYQKSINSMLETAVNFPNRQQFAIAEIIRVLGATKCDTIDLKRTLQFYKYSNRISVSSLEWRLVACGILTNEDIAASLVSPFLAKILFQEVTNSVTECAEYCVNVWLERVEAQHRTPKEIFILDLPNPMEHLKNEDSTGLSCISSVILDLFSELNIEQRKALLSECSLLLGSIPSQFCTRVIIGFYLFLELFKNLSNTSNHGCLAEVETWTDTWLHLLASSLFGNFKTKISQPKIVTQTQQSDLSVHHILCGLMVSTNSFKLLKSHSSTQRKILKGLGQLTLCSSGFTLTWLNIIKSYF